MGLPIGRNRTVPLRYLVLLAALACAVPVGSEVVNGERWGCAAGESAGIASWPGSGLNPLRRTKITRVRLLGAQSVRVEVTDAVGRRVWRQEPFVYPAGLHLFTWDGVAESGREVGAGLYTVKFLFGERQTETKLLLLAG